MKVETLNTGNDLQKAIAANQQEGDALKQAVIDNANEGVRLQSLFDALGDANATTVAAAIKDPTISLTPATADQGAGTSSVAEPAAEGATAESIQEQGTQEEQPPVQQ